MGALVHTSEKTKGFYCDGQGCFEVLVRRKHHREIECYWCGQIHGYFDPKDMTEKDCPKTKLSREPWTPQFNRGWKEL